MTKQETQHTQKALDLLGEIRQKFNELLFLHSKVTNEEKVILTGLNDLIGDTKAELKIVLEPSLDS